jgi:hypothetical protein
MANTPYNTKAETDALLKEIKRQFGTGIIGVIYPNVSGIPQFNGADVTQNGIYIVGADGDYGDITGITLTNQIVLLDIKDIDTTPVYNDIITDISLTISDTPTENGTDAFSTGGAYNLESNLNNVKEALRVPPTYIQPTVSITNVSQTVEKGTTLTDLDVNISFTQNDAGLADAYSLEQDGVLISTTQNSTVTLSNITSSIVFEGFVSYEEGAVKNDNFNEPNTTGQILAGIKESSTRTITPRLYVFYGATANNSVDSDDVRALNKLFDNRSSITLSTGTSNTIFEVAVSSTKTTASSLSAQDTTNNISLTYDFDRLITINLPTGTQEYRIYKLTIGSAYPTSANHVIQL